MHTAPKRLAAWRWFRRAVSTAFALIAPVLAGMELGSNFWNPGWHKPDDCFRDVQKVTGDDPWNPQFLRETAIYRSFRFMDWDNTNNSKRERWSERPRRSDPKQNPVAYEWMVDLCNRQGADLWLTLPHRTVTHAMGDAPSDYALCLCLLVKTGGDIRGQYLAPLLDRLDRLTTADLVAAGGVKTGEPLHPGRKLYLDEMSRYFTHFSHYAHVGQAGKGGAWGAIEFTGQPLEQAPKYRALSEWAASNARVSTSRAARPNVLMIAVDDLNDWVGCLGGHPQVKTPHLDALAARGTLFLNAHVQAPLCNPSRASLLTGLRPSTTGIYGLAPGIRSVERTRNVEILPQAFARQGYATFASGKVFHDGSIPAARRTNEFHVWGDAGGYTNLPARKFVTTPDAIKLMDWGVYPDRDEDQPDWKIADAAVAHLRTAPCDRPFFIATGFRLPHVPCYATRKWFDLYPEVEVILPAVQTGDRADTPRFSWFLHWKLPEPRLSWLQANDQWRALVRAYLASVSFMDSQVGRVLDELKTSGHEGDTVVVLWSDNGWHLGEKGITGKNSLWDRSTRVPLIFAGPGVSRGARCLRPAELLDVYPTLVELCGLPANGTLEGHSLVPQLRDSVAPRAWPAITTHNAGNHAVRSERWRYIRYADRSEELYDVAADPHEWTNLIARAELAGVVADHRRWLPANDAPPAPASAHRVLTYDPATRQATWEGKLVVEAELEE